MTSKKIQACLCNLTVTVCKYLKNFQLEKEENHLTEYGVIGKSRTFLVDVGMVGIEPRVHSLSQSLTLQELCVESWRLLQLDQAVTKRLDGHFLGRGWVASAIGWPL